MSRQSSSEDMAHLHFPAEHVAGRLTALWWPKRGRRPQASQGLAFAMLYSACIKVASRTILVMVGAASWWG